MRAALSLWAFCMFILISNTILAQTVTIGTGTSSSYLYGPYYRSSATSTFNYSRYAHLYTAAELGIPAGSTITEIEWYKVSGTLTGNNVFNVLMLNTSATSLSSGSTWGSLTSGATTVYASTTKSFTVTGNWESIVLSTPFVYTGGNLLIFTDHQKLGTASGSNNFEYTTATGMGIGYASSAAPSSSSTLTTTYGNRRPNIRITYTGGCSAPAISTHPSSVVVCNGANTSFSISTATPDPTYQWQMSTNGGSTWSNMTNGGIYTGVTTSSLNLTGVTTSLNNYQYRCVLGVTCSTATVNSNAATLAINSSPVVTSDPTSTAICQGNSTGFTVAATGSSLGYQWQVNTGSGYANVTNGGIYSGATTSSLSISNAGAGMNGYQYRCEVSGICSPSQLSSAATLVVNPATVITNHPDNITICPAANATYSVTAVGTSLTYQWQQSINSGVSWTNLTNTSPFSNVTTASLTITAVPIAMNGYMYRCIVSGACSAPQTSTIGALNVNSSIPIPSGGQPQNVVTCFNTNASFSVVAASTGIIYQWQVNTGSGFSNISNGGVYSGATTATLNLSGLPLSMNGYVYRCMVSNACVAPFSTSDATLTVNSYPGISTQPSAVTTCEGTNPVFTVAGTGLGISYQWQQNTGSGFVNLPATIAGYTGQLSDSLTLINTTAAMNGYQFRCVVNGQCAPPAVSGAAVLTIQGKPTITAQPTDQHICAGGNTSFSLSAIGNGLSYQWQSNSGSGYSNISNGGVYAGVTTNTLSLTAPPASMFGTDYRCIVSGTCNPVATSAVAKLYVNTAPVIMSHPADRMVCEGSGTTFSVYATAQSSTTPITYQWQVNNGTGYVNIVNGLPYSGVTTATLTLSTVSPSLNTYRYRCIISAACTPQAQTNDAVLTVKEKPVIAKHPVNVTACPTTTATFTVSASGSNLSYRWQENKGSGYVNMNDNTVYSGTITPKLDIVAAASMNNWQYRCVVTGFCSPSVTSDVAKLTVLNPVVISDHTISDSVCEGGTLKFGVTASGNSLKYQWQRKVGTGNYIDLENIPPYSGVNTDSLRFTKAPDTIGGFEYRCRVYETLLCGLSFYTADIPLYMNYAPTTSPATLTTGPGKVAIFTVPASGSSYVWQENKNDGSGFKTIANVPPYGVNQNTLTISPVSQMMNGNTYRCIIDGVCKDPVVSKSSILYVDPLNVQATSAKGTKIYPNPANEVLYIEGIETGTSIQLTDVLGRVRYSIISPSQRGQGGGIISIPTKDLPAGNYVLHLVYADGTRDNVKVVKE